MPEVTASYGTTLDFILFSKLSQIVCLNNINILVCQLNKCDCRLSNLKKVLLLHYATIILKLVVHDNISYYIIQFRLY